MSNLIAAPADPAAFIAEAKAITNRRDRYALEEIFASTATWNVLIDGLQFTAVGHHEIQQRWRQLCDFMDRRAMVVDKHVVVTDRHTIVSSWNAHCRGGASPTGYEIWRFDNHGQVAESTLTGHLNPVPAHSLRGGARYLRASPRNAVAFALSRNPLRKSDHAH